MSNAQIPTKPMWRPLLGLGPPSLWHLHDRHGRAQFRVTGTEELKKPWLRIDGDHRIYSGMDYVGEMCGTCFDEWYTAQFQMADGSIPQPSSDVPRSE